MQEKHYIATMTNEKLTGCTEFEYHTIEISINNKKSVELSLN